MIHFNTFDLLYLLKIRSVAYLSPHWTNQVIGSLVVRSTLQAPFSHIRGAQMPTRLGYHVGVNPISGQAFCAWRCSCSAPAFYSLFSQISPPEMILNKYVTQQNVEDQFQVFELWNELALLFLGWVSLFMIFDLGEVCVWIFDIFYHMQAFQSFSSVLFSDNTDFPHRHLNDTSLHRTLIHSDSVSFSSLFFVLCLRIFPFELLSIVWINSFEFVCFLVIRKVAAEAGEWTLITSSGQKD